MITRKDALKDKVLKERGIMNPYPEKVTDPLFVESDFFDPRDLVQVKYEMLRRTKKQGWSVTKSSSAFGFSRVAFYRALAAFQKAGIFGLLPQKRGPRGAHKLSSEVVDFARKVLEEAPSLSTAELPGLIKEHFGVSVHRRSIERALARAEKKG